MNDLVLIPVAIHYWGRESENWVGSSDFPVLEVSCINDWLLDRGDNLNKPLYAAEYGFGYLAWQESDERSCTDPKAVGRTPTVFRVARLPGEPKTPEYREKIVQQLRALNFSRDGQSSNNLSLTIPADWLAPISSANLPPVPPRDLNNRDKSGELPPLPETAKTHRLPMIILITVIVVGGIVVGTWLWNRPTTIPSEPPKKNGTTQSDVQTKESIDDDKLREQYKEVYNLIADTKFSGSPDFEVFYSELKRIGEGDFEDYSEIIIDENVFNRNKVFYKRLQTFAEAYKDKLPSGPKTPVDNQKWYIFLEKIKGIEKE